MNNTNDETTRLKPLDVKATFILVIKLIAGILVAVIIPFAIIANMLTPMIGQ